MQHPLQADYRAFDEISRRNDNASSLEHSVKWHPRIYVQNERKIY